MADDIPVGYRVDGSPIYDNAATVVCVLTSDDFQADRLLTIRRKSGKLGLPGGFHMRGEKWEQAGAREVLEETGYIQDPTALVQMCDVETDDYGHNMIFGMSMLTVKHDPEAVLDGEALEVLFVEPSRLTIDDWEFPLHYYASIRWLDR